MFAQKLYEGIELGEEGRVGLITYMRTDSTRLSEDAVREAREYIYENYGKEYVPHEARQFKKGKASQDAHEAIRPTSMKYSTEGREEVPRTGDVRAVRTDLEPFPRVPDEPGDRRADHRRYPGRRVHVPGDGFDPDLPRIPAGL